MWENHKIAEELMLPLTVILFKIILGSQAIKRPLSLSNNTVQRRITDRATNIENTLLSQLNKYDMFALHGRIQNRFASMCKST